MAEVDLNDKELVIRLTPLEKVAALRGDLRVPISRLRGAEIVEDPFAILKGFRAPGTSIARVLAAGTWRYRGSKSFVILHRRERAVRIQLVDHELDQLVIGTRQPEQLLERLSAWL